MENFFERMEPWRKPEGALHLYVLPHGEELDRFVAAQATLADIANLPLMPGPYLHCTVLRLAQFDDEVTQADLTALGTALESLCSGLPSFDLEFGTPSAGETAVVVTASDSRDWKHLVGSCREVVSGTWGTVPPTPPAVPHLSLAYAQGPVPDALLAERLAEVEPLGTIHVRSLHLVSVTVRPERGTFDFTSLATWDLASHAG